MPGSDFQKQVQEIETSVLIKNLYNGSVATFIHDYFDGRALSTEEVLELKKVVSSCN